jgi:hypothetical protein
MICQAYPDDKSSALAADKPALSGLRILARIIADHHMKKRLESASQDLGKDSLSNEPHIGTKDGDDKEMDEDA